MKTGQKTKRATATKRHAEAPATKEAADNTAAPRPIIVSRIDLARLMGITANEVSKLLPEGLPALKAGKKGEKSRYDAVEVLKWWREKSSVEKAGERERYFRLQGDKLEQELRARAKELLEVADVEKVWADIVLGCRERILSIPGAALQRSVVNDAGEEVLIALVDEALKDLSQWKQR